MKLSSKYSDDNDYIAGWQHEWISKKNTLKICQIYQLQIRYRANI